MSGAPVSVSHFRDHDSLGPSFLLRIHGDRHPTCLHLRNVRTSFHPRPVPIPIPTPVYIFLLVPSLSLRSGKTWTIAFAVRVLLARGASVLITSYTHSAVDNLLLKLLEEGVPCLRVGKPSSVHPGVREHCINYDGSAKTTAAYSELVASAK